MCQAVTLAAGVDGRIARLDLLAGTHWFAADDPAGRGPADVSDRYGGRGAPRRPHPLSAPGSRLMLEHLVAATLEEGRPVRERVEGQGAKWFSTCYDPGELPGGHGWRARVYAGDDPRIGHGRTVTLLPTCWLAAAEHAAQVNRALAEGLPGGEEYRPARAPGGPGCVV
ncbi:hypothetical protein ACFWN1_03390 [Streptomyces sp. NPDC058459]|uniref:hypothetical protein n=1 Tax=Streptomyces sp. NPDC058459 TaxID=3346508 RepID=UPI00366060F1